MAEKRFYWLKLKRDFFKRHDIKIIESMPNGKDYLLFYLKLLCESVDHDGTLRFSETIPYNENMLSTITDTNIDIVRSAIEVFTRLELMDIMDDGTYYMNQVEHMIGSAVDNDNANRQRRFRERQKQLALCDSYDSVTKNNESKSKSKSIELEKELEIDIEKDKEREEKVKDKRKNNKKEKENEKEAKVPFGEYQNVKLTMTEYDRLANDLSVEVRDACIEFLDAYIEEKDYKSKSHNLAIRRWVVDAVNKKSPKKTRSVAEEWLEAGREAENE